MKTKSLLKIALLFTMLFSVIALANLEVCAATEGTCGENLSWTLDSNGTLTISGTGDMDIYGTSSMPWYSSLSDIKKVVISDGVTSIGNNAFYNFAGIQSVEIPDSVTKLGTYAFRGCTGLKSITIPKSITTMGAFVFYYCSGLTEIYWNAENITAFTNTTKIFNAETGNDTVVIFGNNITTVPDYMFYQCTKIKSVVFSDSITSIGSKAFYGCTGLTSVELPSGLTSIGADAFRNCSGITSISIPKTVSGIGTYAFYGWSALDSVYIEDLAAWCNITFGNQHSNPIYYGKSLYINGVLADNIRIPDGVTSISAYAFRKSGVTSVTIPESMASINNNAFYECSNLANVYYYGTPEQWSGISVGTNNAPLTNAARHYAATVYFDANGGACETESQKLIIGIDVLVFPEAARDGYELLGWSRDSQAETAEYLVGEEYIADGDTVFYAVWKIAVIIGDIVGDVDRNGAVDLSDLMQMLNYINYNMEISQDDMPLMDVYKDTYFNIKDVLKMAQYLAGWSNVVLGE